MTNEEYLKKRKDKDDRVPLLTLEDDIEYRKAIALEIIAETLMKIDSKMDCMMTDDGKLKVITWG